MRQIDWDLIKENWWRFSRPHYPCVSEQAHFDVLAFFKQQIEKQIIDGKNHG